MGYRVPSKDIGSLQQPPKLRQDTKYITPHGVVEAEGKYPWLYITGSTNYIKYSLRSR